MSFEPNIVQKMGMQLGYLAQRQTLLAQNIANIDTPTYRAQDLKKPDFDKLVRDANRNTLGLASTSTNHASGAGKTAGYRAEKDRDAFQRKPLGNTVSLEEQMGNVSDVSTQYQLTSTLLKKFNQLYRMAVDSRSS